VAIERIPCAQTIVMRDGTRYDRANKMPFTIDTAKVVGFLYFIYHDTQKDTYTDVYLPISSVKMITMDCDYFLQDGVSYADFAYPNDCYDGPITL
jgi:hypothetical protein